MYCVVCNHNDTKVIDSRLSNDGMAIRRRRECLKCNYRFSTNEEMEILDLIVMKRDGSREAYNRDKIEKGLRSALQKRPMTKERFKNLLSGIEREIQKKKKKELTSLQIGEIVMRKLKTADKVAYVRFASVYSAFEDVERFQEALENLVNVKRKVKRKP